MSDTDPEQILGDAAHELKNALAPLVITLQIFESRAAAGEPIVAADVTEARRQLRGLAQLVDDLLDATRLASGQLDLQAAPVDVASLVVETVAAFQTGSGRSVTLAPAPQPPVMVDGDAVRLAGILTNLLDNAAKYSPPYAPIEVEVRAHGDALVCVAVTDHGAGISAEDKALLFGRYFRAAATARKARGLGLGLFLSRIIAERHGGSIRVASTLGEGSTFSLDLPVRPPSA